MMNIQDILGQTRGLRIQIARELNITHGAVSQWREVPAKHVMRVAEIVKMDPRDLRPDMFPEPTEGRK